MKTSELTDTALDWAVAKCEGATDIWQAPNGEWCIAFGEERYFFDEFEYSESWLRGGPIIEREGISTIKQDPPAANWWAFLPEQRPGDAVGPTPLIAAMRCYVTSKLGDDVDIPEELLTGVNK